MISEGRNFSQGVRQGHPQGEVLPQGEEIETDWLKCLKFLLVL